MGYQQLYVGKMPGGKNDELFSLPCPCPPSIDICPPPKPEAYVQTGWLSHLSDQLNRGQWSGPIMKTSLLEGECKKRKKKTKPGQGKEEARRKQMSASIDNAIHRGGGQVPVMFPRLPFSLPCQPHPKFHPILSDNSQALLFDQRKLLVVQTSFPFFLRSLCPLT